MNKFLEKVPLGLVNLVTIISGVLTIFTAIITIIDYFRTEQITPKSEYLIALIFLFCLVLLIRMRKYRTLANARMKKTSVNYHSMLHSVKNLYFELLKTYKNKVLDTSSLNTICVLHLSNILDNLCDTFSTFTGKTVSASIKLVSYSDTNINEEITTENIKLITFCRSLNSSLNRGEYEKNIKKDILLKDNTDFLEIISPENTKDYFYQKNLFAYEKKLEKEDKHYKNSNPNWKKQYKSTIVVPIKIEYDKLCNLESDKIFHIIGFLCIDSEYTDAFTHKQEKYNVELAKSYADIIYLVLSQYKYYSKRIQNKNN